MTLFVRPERLPSREIGDGAITLADLVEAAALSIYLEQCAETPPTVAAVVVDNPGFAWRNSDQSCLRQLHPDLVHDYRELLDIAAVEAVGLVLADEWGRRGYVMTHGTDDEVQHRPAQPDDATYWAVWDHIAGQLDPDALVTAAGLDDERRTTYSD